MVRLLIEVMEPRPFVSGVRSQLNIVRAIERARFESTGVRLKKIDHENRDGSLQVHISNLQKMKKTK